ncbi:DinB family protein [Marinobacterium sp. D7]|uniref:DinB family protein n=1 Tax=Marinobacterium ramblicola TaxID=2849041 RepID=UPI001C2D8993|nr:DinB family protein [Marinobacterium ramblicola]MBV1788420.1 DinB family protein [Marinobacterium ramblicola]
MNAVQTLTRYKAWADDLFLSTVAELPESELIAPRPIRFGSIIHTLNHSYAMDFVWKCHLTGQPHGLTTRNPTTPPAMSDLVIDQHAIDRWFIDYADTLTDTQLKEVVPFEFIGGGEGAMSREDIILHVVNHTTYHRGHVADMLYTLDVFPPTTDLPVFLRSSVDS